MNESLLREKLEHYFCEGEDKARNELHANWIRKVVEECLHDLLRGQPEISPQTIRWLKNWFAWDIEHAVSERCTIGSKVLSPTNVPKTATEEKPQ